MSPKLQHLLSSGAASSTGTLDLNTLIEPSLNWRLLDATAINTQGQIIGRGIYQNQARAFLLTPRSTTEPVPEPITMGGTLLGGVGLAYLRRRQCQLRSSKIAG
ncbi:PEP-CTERM sorting domain-containing protein [Nostoc sp. LEGE 06077]|uniref:PEP-CTERM sorting domain-containing protein n=1 Tax=Nostoc sp. LEGE 06077 TaxID=915325 RepID=UPI0018803951|nr:PEP-CTERM sorting domain-containing protein [Nostoc sp. LEGE 06077]MBE9205915.1 PEP-CTERM sorting domain-containing protein [Nostoc sp. LEGE 06077]